MAAAKANIKKQPQAKQAYFHEQEWISPEDSMPEEGTWVLTYQSGLKDHEGDYSSICVMKFLDGVWVNDTSTEDSDDWQAAGIYITHWMPLPKPPTKKCPHCNKDLPIEEND